MTAKEMRVVDMMNKYGGSFVHALAKCFYLADRSNFQKLRAVFSDYWEQYEEMAKKAEKDKTPLDPEDIPF